MGVGIGDLGTRLLGYRFWCDIDNAEAICGMLVCFFAS
jgi:hypothetical protein